MKRTHHKPEQIIGLEEGIISPTVDIDHIIPVSKGEAPQVKKIDDALREP